ncbi:hypothetical protein RHMOL_Rhmol04G0209800 [Rhododendron molle]|uniref:Uncharacterized protein n=1 Tax=Rhododendron molle TaxID=49168 RepID=A0ACC0P2L0_RHOML|nr:hypothetical protein RHMOL_Rhmol04G0209800 [Rhododendron molle]
MSREDCYRHLHHVHLHLHLRSLSKSKQRLADVPPLNLATVLADIQRNMAIMQQRADQADTSMATLRALIEERLPPPGGAGGGGEGREREPEVEENLRIEIPTPNSKIAALIAKMTKLEESVSKSEKIGAAGLDMDRLCPFPNARLPERFKMLDFAKFDALGILELICWPIMAL